MFPWSCVNRWSHSFVQIVLQLRWPRVHHFDQIIRCVTVFYSVRRQICKAWLNTSGVIVIVMSLEAPGHSWHLRSYHMPWWLQKLLMVLPFLLFVFYVHFRGFQQIHQLVNFLFVLLCRLVLVNYVTHDKLLWFLNVLRPLLWLDSLKLLF